MKNFIIFLLLLLALTGCKSCKEPLEGNVIVTLNATVGSQPLSFTNTIYNDGVDKEFYFSKLKFYVSNVRLVRADNVESPLVDVAYFDWADNNWKKFSGNADAGTYKGIKFFVGLSPQQNATNPDDFKDDHPLGPKDDMYWEWLKHRFVNLEGRADTLGNNFLGGSTGLVYHIGRDTCYREVVLTAPEFTVQNTGKKNLQLNLDLLKIFSGANAIDMYQQPGTQSEDGDLPIAIKFADKFAQSFTYSE